MHLSILLSELRIGGAERQFAALARGLTARGHRVRFITLFAGGALAPELVAAGLPPRPLLRRRPRRPGLALPRLARALRRELEADPPQVLYSGDYATNLLAASVADRRSIPVVWSVRQHGSGVGVKARAFRSLGRRLRGRVALCVSNSRAGLEHHERLGYLPRAAVVIRSSGGIQPYRSPNSTRRNGRLRSISAKQTLSTSSSLECSSSSETVSTPHRRSIGSR